MGHTVKIVIGMDSSPASQCVLEEAAARPWPANAEFSIVTVVDVYHFAQLPAIVEDARREGNKLVRLAGERLSRAGHKPHTELLLGVPRQEIAAYAKRWQAQLILVGSHGQGTLSRFLLGSVAQGVLRTAPCSVEIVRLSTSGSPASSHSMKIMLATDGSEFSTAAAKAIANRPWPTGSEIKILSVEELPNLENQMMASPLSAIYPASLLEELLESSRHHAKEAVETARKILVTGKVRILNSKPAPVGDPRVLILDHAKEWGADLIVLGSHGRRGLDRMLMGSVSQAVAMHAHYSVEVSRP
jgi:nucleotide-binding universal stress UspA family protein